MSKKNAQDSAMKKAMQMNSIKDFLSMTVIFLVFLVVWELLVRILDVPRYILPAPSVAIVAFFQYWTAMVPHMMATLSVIIIGFGLTILISIPSATMVAYSSSPPKLNVRCSCGGISCPAVLFSLSCSSNAASSSCRTRNLLHVHLVIRFERLLV